VERATEYNVGLYTQRMCRSNNLQQALQTDRQRDRETNTVTHTDKPTLIGRNVAATPICMQYNTQLSSF